MYILIVNIQVDVCSCVCVCVWVPERTPPDMCRCVEGQLSERAQECVRRQDRIWQHHVGGVTSGACQVLS